MKIAVTLILALAGIVIAGQDEGQRDKRHLVLVSPEIVYVPAPVVPVLNAPRAPVSVLSSFPCGQPAYTCQGPCKANGVRGIPAVKGEYPWLAQIYMDGRHFCSGSIVDNHFILIAASCLEHGHQIASPATVAKLRVRVGDFNLNSNSDGHYTERNVTTFYRHTDFRPPPTESYPTVHDIALLKLSDPIPFTEYIRPICLDDGSVLQRRGVEAVVAGYGLLTGSSTNGVLHKVNAAILEEDDCIRTWNDKGIPLTRKVNICAGTPTVPSVASCVEDKGGPLIVKTGANSYTQVGIASFAKECAGPPTVFTRVSVYKYWIEQVRMQKV